MRLTGCASLTRRPLTGVWFRAIRQKHFLSSLNTAHTALIDSRFSSGSASAPMHETLYLAESPLAAMFEARAWVVGQFESSSPTISSMVQT